MYLRGQCLRCSPGRNPVPSPPGPPEAIPVSGAFEERDTSSIEQRSKRHNCAGSADVQALFKRLAGNRRCASTLLWCLLPCLLSVAVCVAEMIHEMRRDVTGSDTVCVCLWGRRHVSTSWSGFLPFSPCNRLLVTACGDKTVDQTLSTWQDSLYNTPPVSDAGVQSSEHLLKGVRFQAASQNKILPRASGSTKGRGLCGHYA